MRFAPDRRKLNLQGRLLIMRTNIVIDDKLMDDALKLTGLRTKR